MLNALEILKKNIAKLCQERGWSQTQLAKAAGVDQSQVNKWLTGKHTPSMDALAQLAGALSVPVDALLREGEPVTVVTRQLTDLELLEALQDRLTARMSKPIQATAAGSTTFDISNDETALAKVHPSLKGRDFSHVPPEILEALLVQDERVRANLFKCVQVAINSVVAGEKIPTRLEGIKQTHEQALARMRSKAKS